MSATMNDTMAVGQRLVELCREQKNLEAIEALYADDVVSVEATADLSFDQVMNGREAVVGKNTWWLENHTVHEAKVEGPFPHGDRFATVATYDITPKTGPMEGNRFTMQEVCLYTVEAGKVVKEEFFYAT